MKIKKNLGGNGYHIRYKNGVQMIDTQYVLTLLGIAIFLIVCGIAIHKSFFSNHKEEIVVTNKYIDRVPTEDTYNNVYIIETTNGEYECGGFSTSAIYAKLKVGQSHTVEINGYNEIVEVIK